MQGGKWDYDAESLRPRRYIQNKSWDVRSRRWTVTIAYNFNFIMYRPIYRLTLMSLYLCCQGWNGLNPLPQFMSTDAHFWVKIGFKVQSRCKLSNSSTSDHPGFLANSNTDYRWSLEDGYCDVQWGDTFSITIIAARMRVNDEWRLTRWSMALSVTLLLLLLAGMLCRRVTRGQWTIDQWFRHLSSSITNRIAAVRRRQHQRCCTTLPFGRRIAPSVRLYASANL